MIGGGENRGTCNRINDKRETSQRLKCFLLLHFQITHCGVKSGAIAESNKVPLNIEKILVSKPATPGPETLY